MTNYAPTRAATRDAVDRAATGLATRAAATRIAAWDAIHGATNRATRRRHQPHCRRRHRPTPSAPP